MGGALAQLASYDLAAAIKEAGLDVQLCCYTFGSPRVGNSPFAAAYEATVPNTWNVINDQVGLAFPQVLHGTTSNCE